MKKLTTLLSLLLTQGIAFADTTLVTNVNGYTLNADRELQTFVALQFSC